jgi:hypothetical protein
MFRKHLMHRRMLAGEFVTRVLSERDPDPAYGQPPGTKSQMVEYKKDGKQVAVVHQYLLPNGKFGGRSKKPSPKALRLGDTLYFASARSIR